MKQEAEGSGPSPFMLHDEQAHPALRGLPCCWSRVSQTRQGTCCVTPPPCCHHSSEKEPRQEHLHIPPIPAWLSQGYDGCLDISLSLSSTGNWRQLNYPIGHNGPMHSGTAAPCIQCFDTVNFVPNWGSGPRSLLWDFAVPGSLDTSNDVRPRGSVFKIKDWQLSLCKENDWLYLFLIHCYLVHMHNSCLILVVISRKYCLSLSQQNSLSRCPLKKKKNWIWKKLKISPKGKHWEITRAVS